MSFDSDKPIVQSIIYDAAGNPVSSVSVPSDPGNIVSDFVKSGGSPNLIVDGSGTPIEFVFNAHVSEDIALIGLDFVGTTGDFKLDDGSAHFGQQNELGNGLKVEIRSNNETVEIFNFKQNEHFAHFSGGGDQFTLHAMSKDFMRSSWNIGGAIRLVGGSGDFVKVTVRDKLTDGPSFYYLQCFVKAIKGA